jgi:CheY-like chemotaxis protein
MSLSVLLGPELPYLRRYARALSGSQTMGDAVVMQTLEALLAEPGAFSRDQAPRLELYRVFHKLSGSLPADNGADGVFARIPLRERQALLLTAVEGFSISETATILGTDADEIAAEIEVARLAITDSLTAKVMIIEDEAIIALHIQSIVEDLGHSITGIARTRKEASALATQSPPDLVLADISLADGSSGIDAVRDILGIADVPVIFITAFPERLLTGERPEPAYLITKPFEPETVTATIGQALLVHRELQAAASHNAPHAQTATA